MSKYEFEWLDGIKSMVGVGKLGRVYKYDMIPLADTDRAKLVEEYGDEYSGCTHALICAEVQAIEDGDEQVVIVTHVVAEDGSSPSDTPMYEHFGTPWQDEYNYILREAREGTLME